MFNSGYLLFALPALLFGLYAQFRIKSAYSKYLRVRSSSGMSGFEAAQRLLRMNGLEQVQIGEIPGQLTDHYDPARKTLGLSSSVARSASLAGLAIVAHEVGHASQDSQGYAMLKVRSGLVPIVQIGSMLGPILFMVGLLLQFTPLAMVGLVLFSGTLVFTLITLPVEYNASARALDMLTTSGLVTSREEERGARAVLSAAALTYVAATIQSLANLLYYASILTGSRRR